MTDVDRESNELESRTVRGTEGSNFFHSSRSHKHGQGTTRCEPVQCGSMGSLGSLIAVRPCCVFRIKGCLHCHCPSAYCDGMTLQLSSPVPVSPLPEVNDQVSISR